MIRIPATIIANDIKYPDEAAKSSGIMNRLFFLLSGLSISASPPMKPAWMDIIPQKIRILHHSFNKILICLFIMSQNICVCYATKVTKSCLNTPKTCVICFILNVELNNFF